MTDLVGVSLMLSFLAAFACLLGVEPWAGMAVSLVTYLVLHLYRRSRNKDLFQTTGNDNDA